jgi:hypothetical protein
MINISSSQASSILWNLQRIHRCIDLAFLFKGQGELWLKVIEAEECISEALVEANFASKHHLPECRSEAIANVLKCLEVAEGAITEALSVASPYHREQGAIANLRAGRKAIIELHSSITK